MIIDRYTKIILTVIAVSLAVMAFSNLKGTMIKPAIASSDCGGYLDPCYVKIKGTVTVQEY